MEPFNGTFINLIKSNPMSETAMAKKPNVLIVDDNESNTFLLESIFRRLDINLIVANSAKEALIKIKDIEISLALLDIVMPGMDGLTLARKIESDTNREKIPIIFITAIEKNAKDLQECYDAGGVDFIVKPFEKNILLSKVNVFLDLYRQKQQIVSQKAEIEKKANELEAINRSLKTRLAYENMLSTISGMAVLVEDIEDFLEASLTLMGEATDVSRTYIFKYNPEKNVSDNTHEWCNADVTPQKAKLQRVPDNKIHYWTEILKKGEIINFSNIQEIPDENVKQILLNQNILSVLVMPIFVESSFYGFIGFDNCLNPKDWVTQDVSILQAVTRIIASAIGRNLSESALRDSEAKFKHIFESANVGKSITHPTYGLTVNKAFGDIVGYSPEELRYTSWQAITPAEEIKHVQEKLSSMLKGKKDSDRFEKRYIHKNGSIVWTDLSLVIQRDTKGKPLYFITTIVDITDRKRVEESIRKLSQAVEQSPASVVITNLKGDIEYVNAKFVEVSGYSFEEVLGKNPRILKSGKQSPETYTELWNTITSGNEWQGEFENLKKNGELFWESVSISPIRSEDGKITHFLAVKEDVTKRKNAEKAFYYSESKLRRITDNISDVVYTSDLNFKLTYITPSIEKLTGHKLDIYLNLSNEDRIPECTYNLTNQFKRSTTKRMDPQS